jgi:plasmid stabilization system protein ParE
MAGSVDLEWSLDALADLDRFAAFLHEQHPDLAGRVAQQLISRAEVLRRHPSSGGRWRAVTSIVSSHFRSSGESICVSTASTAMRC